MQTKVASACLLLSEWWALLALEISDTASFLGTEFMLMIKIEDLQYRVVFLCVCVLVTQSCPALCNPIDCSLPGFSVHGILQARILEWVTISFSRGSSQPRDRTRVSHIGGRHLTSEPPGKTIYALTYCIGVSISALHHSV